MIMQRHLILFLFTIITSNISQQFVNGNRQGRILHEDHLRVLQQEKLARERKEKMRAATPPGKGDPNGWGDDFKWHTLQDAKHLVKSGEVYKPILLLMHTENCKICDSISDQFQNSRAIKKLSESFVMVNILDEEDPGESKNTYIHGYPRIMFLDGDGKVRPEIRNPKTKYSKHNYPYYYGSIAHMVEGMRSALHQMPHGKSARVHHDEF